MLFIHHFIPSCFNFSQMPSPHVLTRKLFWCFYKITSNDPHFNMTNISLNIISSCSCIDNYIDAFVNEPLHSSFAFWKLIITSNMQYFIFLSLELGDVFDMSKWHVVVFIWALNPRGSMRSSPIHIFHGFCVSIKEHNTNKGYKISVKIHN